MRINNRLDNELRPIVLVPQCNAYAEGSCRISCGNTIVLCTATVEHKVPSFLRGTNSGWITAEYSMLPRATLVRTEREAIKGKQSGRTQEIQRLIGRSLRAVVDLKLLGERQIRIDCDVLQADGGTRTASITGSYVALFFACQHLLKHKLINIMPLQMGVAAISCGFVANKALLDLDYQEDSNAEIDSNFVMTTNQEFVELQITGEKNTLNLKDLDKLIALAKSAIAELWQLQKAVIDKYQDSK